LRPSRYGRQIAVTVALAYAALGGCKHKEEPAQQAPAKEAPAEHKDDPAVDVASANSKIPEAWKGKLEFMSQTLESHGDKVVVAAPKGWKPSNIGALEPPDGSGFGFGTKFWTGKTCNGECKARSAADWGASADKVSFANELAHQPAPKILKDDKRDGFRELVAEDQHIDGNINMTSILMAWWKDGADRMYFCNVELAPESKDLVWAFEQACGHLRAEF
jgi:hypothetical protein